MMSIRLSILIALSLAVGCGNRSFSESVKMRDGVHLATDVYLPKGDGPFPTKLYRTPYGRTGLGVQSIGLNRNGVALVVQSLRGRQESEGIDRIFTTDGDGDLKDGYDTMAWVVDQEWSNGKIGTAGASALGIAQYMAASADPPGLAVLNAEVGTPNVYSDAMFQDGVRRYNLSHGWLESQGSLDFEARLDAHPTEDAFWASAQTHDQYGTVDVPGTHVGGWFDIFGQGTLDAFMGYQYEGGSGAAGQQKLVMGPWTHFGVGKRDQGELKFPANSTEPPGPNVADVYLNHYLDVDDPDVKGHPSSIPNVQYYVMGDVDDSKSPGNEWREADDWPLAAAPVRMHLQPGGGLGEDCPSGSDETTSYKYAPLDPSPTICGNNLKIDAGPCDQRSIESREDVVVFETGKLSAPMEITGRVQAHLFVDINRVDTDLMVRMTDVYPDGRSMLIADSAMRLAFRESPTELLLVPKGEVVEGVVDLWSTSIVLNTGHRLRISITSSNWPRFSVNRNNGLPYPESIEGESGPLTVNVHHSADNASYLEVPDPSRSMDDFTVCD